MVDGGGGGGGADFSPEDLFEARSDFRFRAAGEALAENPGRWVWLKIQEQGYAGFRLQFHVPRWPCWYLVLC